MVVPPICCARSLQVVSLSDKKPIGFFPPKTNLPLPFPSIWKREGREKTSQLGFLSFYLEERNHNDGDSVVTKLPEALKKKGLQFIQPPGNLDFFNFGVSLNLIPFSFANWVTLAFHVSRSTGQGMLIGEFSVNIIRLLEFFLSPA